MKEQTRAIRIGMTVMICLLALAAAKPIGVFLSKPEVASFLIYLQTGRVVDHPAAVTEATEATQPQIATQPQTPTQSLFQDQGVCFEEQDAQLVQVSKLCQYPVDVQALLLTDLQWDLMAQEPSVLIIHSHATESYTKTEQYSYRQSAAYRTLDTQYNMVRVGAELKEALECKGIGVIHDTTLHDHPSYNDSYINSRETVRKWLEEYPSISLVIDLHRDAMEITSGSQLETWASVNGETAAQLMLVVGTDAGGRHHPGWEENMALAAKIHAQLEKRYPGICRPISFRTERFNQDLSTGALLIEVGAAGDTLEKALVAVRALAEGIGDLAAGTITAGSTS